MRLRHWAMAPVIAAAAATFAGAAPAAAVEDLHPTATISIDLGGKAKECIAGKCGNYGGRTATVKWASNCNDASPDLNHETSVYMVSRAKTGKLKDFQEVNVGEGGEGANGSDVVVVPAGVRLFAEIRVACSYSTTDADGNPIEHKGSTSAITGDVFLKPALWGHDFPQNTFCGVSVPNSKVRTTTQAGQYSRLDYFLRFSPFSMLAKTTLNGQLGAIRLHGRGAGLNFSRKPARAALRSRGEYEVAIRPKRGGTLKIWATIGGVKTNVRAIKVYPKRC
jgi:hypothetical protein